MTEITEDMEVLLMSVEKAQHTATKLSVVRYLSALANIPVQLAKEIMDLDIEYQYSSLHK